jgi:hypothetical protein
MAATSLDIRSYALLAKLAEALAPLGGRPDFVLACHHMRTTIDSTNRARQELGTEPLPQEEVLTLIKRTVKEAGLARRRREEQARQVQEVKVQALRTPG